MSHTPRMHSIPRLFHYATNFADLVGFRGTVSRRVRQEAMWIDKRLSCRARVRCE